MLLNMGGSLRSAFKSNATIKSPTQVQNDFQRIIRMIGTPAQPPKPRQKASGRQFGDIQVKRIRHPIVKKSKNTTITEKMQGLWANPFMLMLNSHTV